MTGDKDDSARRRVWTAEQINAQLDEVAEALIQGSHEFVRGFLFGAPRRRRPKPPSPKPEESEQ
jgi:hypothetical protein